MVWKSQLALTNLMEGTSTRLDTIPEMDSMQNESLDDEARRLAKDWYSSGSGWFANLMERLATILEVMRTREETALAVRAPVISVFAPPVNLPKIRPQGASLVIDPRHLHHKATQW